MEYFQQKQATAKNFDVRSAYRRVRRYPDSPWKLSTVPGRSKKGIFLLKLEIHLQNHTSPSTLTVIMLHNIKYRSTN
jgi:hypothetical protein